MIDMNMIIARNIGNALKNASKKQSELAAALDCSKQIVSNMLSGARSITAPELKRIADFCNVSMESLVALPSKPVETNVVRAFMGQVKTEEAKEGIRTADKIIDMYLFHSHVNKQGAIGAAERSSL